MGARESCAGQRGAALRGEARDFHGATIRPSLELLPERGKACHDEAVTLAWEEGDMGNARDPDRIDWLASSPFIAIHLVALATPWLAPPTAGLAGLLTRLDSVSDLRWLRVHYLYPNTVTDRLIEAMAMSPRVVKYVDMPLQHAHPDMLRRMRRGGSTQSHLELLGRFRSAMPDAALRSTFIAGFPGETEREFDELLAFVTEARFDHLGVFTYSHEDGTSAHSAIDDVPEPLKNERRDRIMEVQQRIVFEKNEARLGETVEVLVEGAHAETEHLLVGRASTQAPDVDGQILLNDGHAAPGTFARVLLTETAGYDLVGRILSAA